MRTPTDADLRLCPDNVQEYIDRLTRENADLRARLAAAEKARDEQADRLTKLERFRAAYFAEMDARKCVRIKEWDAALYELRTAAAAVKEAGNG